MIHTDVIDDWGRNTTINMLDLALDILDWMERSEFFGPSGTEWMEFVLSESGLIPWDFSGPIREIYERTWEGPVSLDDFRRVREELTESRNLASSYPEDPFDSGRMPSDDFEEAIIFDEGDIVSIPTDDWPPKYIYHKL